MGKLHVRYPIIVEGKYDKIKLASIIEGTVITTDGFGLFKSREKLALIRRLSEKTEIILLTDSDGGGKVIRSHITSAIPKERLIQLYIPQIKGKEKRKAETSAEGFLGVEGIDADALRSLFLPFSDEAEQTEGQRKKSDITKTDFFCDGLSGGKNSSQMRDALARRLGLPAKMTPNALLEAVKILCTYDEYRQIMSDITLA